MTASKLKNISCSTGGWMTSSWWNPCTEVSIHDRILELHGSMW